MGKINYLELKPEQKKLINTNPEYKMVCELSDLLNKMAKSDLMENVQYSNIVREIKKSTISLKQLTLHSIKHTEKFCNLGHIKNGVLLYPLTDKWNADTKYNF